MNLYPMLKKRERDDAPVRVGVIGAGKFSSMFLNQARFTPGLQVVGIAESTVHTDLRTAKAWLHSKIA